MAQQTGTVATMCASSATGSRAVATTRRAILKGLLSILPWAIVLVLGGAVIWFLLDRQMVAGRWLLAGVLAGHGLVHALFLVPAPTPGSGSHGWPFELTKSWPVRNAGLDPGLMRTIAIILIAVTVITFGLAAVATLGLIVPVGWWGGLVVAGAVASLALLVVAFDLQLILGIGIDVALLVVVLGSLWSPSSA
jgi:hypothetical protein